MLRVHYGQKEYEACWEIGLEAEEKIRSIEDRNLRMIRSVDNNASLILVAEELNKPDEAVKRSAQLLESYHQALSYADTMSPEEQQELFSPVCINFC